MRLLNKLFLSLSSTNGSSCVEICFHTEQFWSFNILVAFLGSNFNTVVVKDRALHYHQRLDKHNWCRSIIKTILCEMASHLWTCSCVIFDLFTMQKFSAHKNQICNVFVPTYFDKVRSVTTIDVILNVHSARTRVHLCRFVKKLIFNQMKKINWAFLLFLIMNTNFLLFYVVSLPPSCILFIEWQINTLLNIIVIKIKH